MKHLPLKLLLLAVFASLATYGQETNSVFPVGEPAHRNVIKYNPTPKLLWSSNNWTFSYERVLKNNKQTVAFTLGYLEFGKLFKDTIANIVALTDRWKNGINFCFEYRFYVLKRNTRPVPDGLYLAPYFSYYGYKFGNGLDLIQTQADEFARMNAAFYFINVGGELGYQFVFWKRLTVDMILLGPSVSYYGGRINIKGDIKWSELSPEIYAKIKEKYPQITDVIVDKSFKKDGTLGVTSIGLRYLIQVGFHF